MRFFFFSDGHFAAVIFACVHTVCSTASRLSR